MDGALRTGAGAWEHEGPSLCEEGSNEHRELGVAGVAPPTFATPAVACEEDAVAVLRRVVHANDDRLGVGSERDRQRPVVPLHPACESARELRR